MAQTPLKNFLQRRSSRRKRMFAHRAVLYPSNLSLITDVRCVIAQLEESVDLWNVSEGQTEWTLSYQRHIECGAVSTELLLC